jgi:hypothetical protein
MSVLLNYLNYKFIYVVNGIFEHPVVVMNVIVYFNHFCHTVQTVQSTVVGKCKGS